MTIGGHALLEPDNQQQEFAFKLHFISRAEANTWHRTGNKISLAFHNTTLQYLRGISLKKKAPENGISLKHQSIFLEF